MYNLNITGVVKHLLAINILMYLGTYVILGDSDRLILSLWPPITEHFQPFQLVSHMFMHATPTHLLFNMIALFMFGPPLEQSMGPKRFLTYYLMTGFGAMALFLLTQYIEFSYYGGRLGPMLGASGAVFGLLAGYGTLFSEQIITPLIPPIPMKAKYFALIYGAIELFFGLSPFETGIAHFAHLGGAIVGFFMILYWYGQKR